MKEEFKIGVITRQKGVGWILNGLIKMIFLIFMVGLMSAGIYNEKNAIIYDLGSVLCAGWMLGQI